jgi:hypothetical protein
MELIVLYSLIVLLAIVAVGEGLLIYNMQERIEQVERSADEAWDEVRRIRGK